MAFHDFVECLLGDAECFGHTRTLDGCCRRSEGHRADLSGNFTFLRHTVYQVALYKNVKLSFEESPNALPLLSFCNNHRAWVESFNLPRLHERNN